MSLYLTYRPKDFDDLVGQGFIKKALTAALAQNKTVGAYLFYGSRGTGKTSVARIFAKAINCLNRRNDGNPCDTCEMCTAFKNNTLLDIIEIDGASNNGVANVRELIEKAKFLPSIGKKKVYIIDEVHMLSIGAFNALLKILEEPPEHVIFILATTELHKIPETIISRTQRFDFRKIAESDIKDRLKYVAEKEGIQAEDGAISLLAKLAKGGLRDALSLFEQYTVGSTLSLEFLEQNLSLIREEILDELFKKITDGDVNGVRNILDQVKQNSSDPRRFLEQCLYFLRDAAYRQMGTPQFSATWKAFQVCTDAYRKLKDFPDGFLLIEVSILGLLSGSNFEERLEIKVPVRVSKIEPTVVISGIPDIQNVPSTPPQKKETSEKIKILPKDDFGEFLVDTTDYGISFDETLYTPEVTKSSHSKKGEQSPGGSRATPAPKPVNSIQETDIPKIKVLGEKKPFLLQDLVAFIRTIPRTALLVAKLKSCKYSWEESTTTFSLTLPNEFDKKMIDKIETREVLGRAFGEVFGIEVTLLFLLPGENRPTNLHPDDLADVF